MKDLGICIHMANIYVSESKSHVNAKRILSRLNKKEVSCMYHVTGFSWPISLYQMSSVKKARIISQYK